MFASVARRAYAGTFAEAKQCDEVKDGKNGKDGKVGS